MIIISSTMAVLIGAYVIGAIPTGYIIARLCGISDITRYGSGNIGATNVGRLLGKSYFLVVLLLDVSKSFFYVSLLQHYSFPFNIQVLVSIMLLLGNGISLFLGGRGGKGVATSIGVMCAFNPLIIILVFVVWLGAFYVTHTIGIASVVGFLSLPLVTLFFSKSVDSLVALSLFIAGWGIIRHWYNIKNFFISRIVR